MKSHALKWWSLCAALALVASFAACDAGLDFTAPPGVAAQAAGPDPHEREAPLSAMFLSLVRSSDGLQARGAPLKFKAMPAALSRDPSAYTVYLNGSLLDESALTVAADALLIHSPLEDGRNAIQVFAPDGAGAPVEAEAVVWAGSAVVQGKVVDESANPVNGARVVAALGDDPTVTATTVTDSAGQYVLKNFPARTVLVTATGPAGLIGLSGATAGVAGGAFPDIVLLGFGAPATSTNKRFLASTAGWINRNGARLSLVEHVQSPGPGPEAARAGALSADPQPDLRIGASGPGPRTATYTFMPPADTRTVRMRYRLQTAALAQFFGSAYSDAFHVVLRTKGAESAAVGASMNALGRDAFDDNGSTAWKELSVELATVGEPVQVEVMVANMAHAGDAGVESAVIVDFVAASPLAITQARLFDIDNSALNYLSAAHHTYFNATTRVHATFKVTGPVAAQLSSLELQVLQAGVLKARGVLAASLSPSLYKAFGASGVELGSAQLAFEIPASELATVNAARDGPLNLKLVAKAGDGSIAQKDMGNVQLLDHWKGPNRYGGRDESRGGDDWLTPTARDACSPVGVTWGDFSNMNAGSFAPDHASHATGRDADGWYAGYNARDAAAAKKMIALLNTPGVGSKVKIVYVTHTPSSGNAFHDAYKDVTLADGRKARSVIRNYAGHRTHFHWHMG
ncbi:carboxypeptidase-like regulatory domain-containing protein [Pantoea sp. 18069]|uniref:carboxypeptidase-like regulatory domain-containing protein n=1 Tax=Pantoea sp. 18069 TaxID=2681415 RepID=UPI0013587D77|nr:carboxypeptidase-like regulatory domain-containing protein [Pantoea sp. 18069]